MALGHLFRRRGDVDRAIRLHQALVQRQDLNDAQKVQALLALGEDYMRSGLLASRRDGVFGPGEDRPARAAGTHSISSASTRPSATAESDRERHAVRSRDRRTMGKLIGQFECELAERQRAAGDIEPRASPLRARTPPTRRPCARHAGRPDRIESGNDRAAIRAFERAARHDSDYLPEILPLLLSVTSAWATVPAPGPF